MDPKDLQQEEGRGGGAAGCRVRATRGREATGLRQEADG